MTKALASASVLLFGWLVQRRAARLRHATLALQAKGVPVVGSGLASVVVMAALSAVWRTELVSLARYLVFGRKYKFAGLFDGELGLLDRLRSEMLRYTALAMGKLSKSTYPETKLPTWHMTLPPPVEPKALQAILDGLEKSKVEWATTPNKVRAVYLRKCITNLKELSEDITKASVACKGSYEGGLSEERLVCVASVKTMREIAEVLEGGPPKVSFEKRPDGQYVANTFPACWWESVFFSGWRGEVWVEPGKAAAQDDIVPGEEKAGVTCVLAAGNQFNLTIEDIMMQMFVHHKVVVCKINPVLGWLGPYIETIFEPLISLGFLKIVDGGVAEGQYLCNSDVVTSVHMTGSAATWDAIVWQKQPKIGEPPFRKFVGGELGGVTPYMVVPGSWTLKEMQYQAKNILAGLAFNASHNCLSAQILVTARHWPQRAQFLNVLRAEMRKLRPRASFYPGTKEKYERFFKEYPQADRVSLKSDEGTYPWVLAAGVSPQGSHFVLQEEVWCGCLAEVALDCSTAAEFLSAARKFCNEKVRGNLSCALFIKPDDQEANAPLFSATIAGLRFGGIAVNAPTLVHFGCSRLTWGGFAADNSIYDINSGNVITHNTSMIAFPEKSVIYAPWSISPTPYWFCDNYKVDELSKGCLELFGLGGNITRLVKCLVPAMLAGAANS